MRAAQIVFVTCGLLATPAWADFSGTYVAGGPTLAIMIQIVETNGGNLAGRYEQVVLEADGEIKDVNATITGVRSGETVVGSLKMPDLLAATVPLSGTYRGGELQITWGANLVLNLSGSDVADFRARVAALTTQSRQIVDARARQEAVQRQAKLEADWLTKLELLTERLAAFTARADAMLPKFDPEAQKFGAVTERMRSGLARQRSIYGNGQASVARNQISVTLGQLAIRSDQIHTRDQQLYQDFDFNSAQLSQDATQANGWCHGAIIPVSLSDVCPKFLDALVAYTQRVSALRSAFTALEATWTTERRAQDAIEKASQQAAQ